MTSSTLISPSTNFYPGLYIVGINTPSLSPFSSFTLQITFDGTSDDTTNPYSYGYSILSVLALILAAGLIILVLMRVCLLYRRRSALHITSSQLQLYEDGGLAAVTVGQTERRTGLTEAEIAKLPCHRFVGVEKWDDGRCSVCLEDYVMGESMLRSLPKCSHSFHKECIDQWLSSHLHCPLCLQSAREGDKGVQSPGVEMGRIIARPTVAVPASNPQAVEVVIVMAAPASPTVVGQSGAC